MVAFAVSSVVFVVVAFTSVYRNARMTRLTALPPFAWCCLPDGDFFLPLPFPSDRLLTVVTVAFTETDGDGADAPLFLDDDGIRFEAVVDDADDIIMDIPTMLRLRLLLFRMDFFLLLLLVASDFPPLTVGTSLVCGVDE